ncbi:MAG: alpha/beta hydrolase [Kiritimatiellales bacterium]|nr:alpha/beta hydrolase [Kiritimatiellales bacterium]
MTENICIRAALYLGGFYLLINLLALLFADRLLFVPQDPSYTQLPRQVKLTTPDGDAITAVYYEHPAARHTILFSHGNAEDLGSVIPFMEQFFDLGYSLVMYDYRGYGTSEGTPSVPRLEQDVSTVYEWLVQEKKVDPQTIIAHGRSLGGAVAVWLAAHHEVGALVIESTFVSAFRVKTHWQLLPWDKFNSLSLIPSVDCPVLVMHGEKDEVVPLWHGKALFDAAPEPKQHFWIEGAMHNDYAYVAGERYIATFQSFMRSIDQSVASMPK